MRRVPWGSAAISRKFLMNPSSLRSFAISTFSLETGTSSRSCLAIWALRIRVNRSAIGSVMLILWSPRLPTRLDDARQITLQRQVPQMDAAEAELAVVAPGATAQLAAIAMPPFEL